MKAFWIALAVALGVVGCATVSSEKGHTEVAALVLERTGQSTRWDKGTPEEAKLAEQVESLLKGGLVRERAVAIALVNSPALQATYEELGIAQADLVQAGLLANPTLEGSVGFPSSDSTGRVEYEGALFMDFLQVLVLPWRKRVAEEQFAVDVLRVAHEALRTVSEVSQAFAEMQAVEELVALRSLQVEASRAAAELTERLRTAGNVTELELVTRQATWQQTRVSLAREELHRVEIRERLNRLLGLWGAQTQWTLAEGLPALPAEESPLEQLEARALRLRLDVDAARKQAALIERAVTLARTTRYFGLVEVGIHLHQDPDGPRLFGPTLSLQLPIFDQRQALIARLEAQARQAERRLIGLSVDVRSQVRVARTQLLAQRQLAEHYRTRLLPLRERAVEQAQLQYNAMQIGLFQLLEAKQQQLEASQLHIEAVRDYWRARAELERALGGSFGPPRPAASPPPSVPSTPKPQPIEEHHEHPTH